MTWVAVAIGGSALLGYAGASKQASAAERGAQMQSDAAARAAALQEKQYADLAPYRTSGQIGLSKIQEMLPYFTKEVTAEDLRGMPGFTFGLEQGTGAAGQAMNVGGGGSNVDLARRKFAIDYKNKVQALLLVLDNLVLVVLRLWVRVRLVRLTQWRVDMVKLAMPLHWQVC